MLLLVLAGSALAQHPPAEPVFRASSKPLQEPAPVPPPVPATMFVAPKGGGPAKIVRVQAEEPTSSTEAMIREFQALLEPPSPEALFGRLDTEKMFEQRMRQQAMQRTPPDRTVQFPERPVISTEQFKGRNFPEQVAYREPNYIMYQRLYTEEKNAERYGWDLGFIQPVVSTLYFYKDVVCFPHNFWSYPCRRYESSAGYCLPGDPVPYILYPPELTLSGIIAEGAVAAGLIAIFP